MGVKSNFKGCRMTRKLLTFKITRNKKPEKNPESLAKGNL